MESALQDLRYAVRILLKNRGFTAVAVITLALGIGASTAVFSAANTFLLRPLPIADIDQVVFGVSLREGFDPFGTSFLEFLACRDRGQSFTTVSVATQRSFNLVQSGEPERVPGAEIDAEYLPTLGVSPILGRSFSSEEARPGAPAVALMSYSLWQRRFGGDSNVAGQSIELDGRSYTILGVMPRGFDVPAAAEIWVPIQVNIEGLPLIARASHGNQMIGRLKPGATLEQTNADLKAIAGQLEQEYPQVYRGWSYKVVPLRQELLADIEGRINKSLYALGGAVAFLLLICCANVANLLLARGVAREREIAIRVALGARRTRLLRQLLTESLLLASAGGGMGLLLAYWLTPALGSLSPIQPLSLSSFLQNIQIDGRGLAFASGVTLLTGIVFGLIPALRAARRDEELLTLIKRNEQRAGKSAGSHRLLGVLIAGEIAVAVTLLSGGGLLIKSFQQLQQVDLGFRRDNLLIMETELSPTNYSDHRRRTAFMDQVLERVKRLPGVASAGMTTNTPLDRDISFDSVFTVEGNPPADPSDVPITAHRLVSPDYLKTIGVELVSGRLLDYRDRADSPPVVVISEELARQGWPTGEDPIGKRIKRGRPDQANFPWMTVVGVVKDVKEDLTNFRINRPVWYLPYAQQENTLPLKLVVKVDGDPSTITAALTDAIHAVDAGQPVSGIATMEAHLSGVLSTERFSAILMGILSLLGLALAAVGLYGVMSYSVNERTGEFGLRMALGARPAEIFNLVVKGGAILVVIGLLLGLTGALILTRFLSASLYGVSPRDPLTLAIISGVLAGVALGACFVPARRATRVDPMIAMRHE